MAAPLAASGPMTVRRAAGSGLDVVLLAVGFIWLRGPASPPLRSRSVRGRPPSSRPRPAAPRRPLCAPASPPPAVGSRARARRDHVLTEGARRRRGGRRRGAGLGSSPGAARGVAAGQRGSDGEEEPELEEEPPPPPGNRASGGPPAQPRRAEASCSRPIRPPGSRVARPALHGRRGEAGAGTCVPPLRPHFWLPGAGPGRAGPARVGPPACLPTVDAPGWTRRLPRRLFRQLPLPHCPPAARRGAERAREWGSAPPPPEAREDRVRRRRLVLVPKLAFLSRGAASAPRGSPGCCQFRLRKIKVGGAPGGRGEPGGAAASGPADPSRSGSRRPERVGGSLGAARVDPSQTKGP